VDNPLWWKEDRDALCAERVEREDTAGWRHVQQRATRLWLLIVRALFKTEALSSAGSCQAASDFHDSFQFVSHYPVSCQCTQFLRQVSLQK